MRAYVGFGDGRMEFAVNFLSNVLAVLSNSLSEQWLEMSLFATCNAQLVESAIGQFAPGAVGGPNATQGMEGESRINPWDYVLMMEGTLLYGGAVTKRLGVDQSGKAAFPFTVDLSAVGYGSAADAEDSRGEIWLPVWSRPASLQEIKVLMAEGRAEVSGRRAKSGLDFSRAIASLGVDRGISSFVRFGFLERNGKAYIATPLGRFDVGDPRPDADLLRQIDPWLDAFRRKAYGKNPLPRIQTAHRRIEQAIFDFCRYGGPSRFAEIICALGNAEREIARTENFHEADGIRPLSGLSPDWIKAAYDGSTEFRIALAVANIYDPQQKIGPIRTNLEPVTAERRPSWAAKDRCVVWNNADLAENLASVLERRIMDAERKLVHHQQKVGRANVLERGIMDAERKAGRDLPIAAGHTVDLRSVASFLWREVDDARIEELLWGLMLVEPAIQDLHLDFPSGEESLTIPRPYAILKHLFFPWPIGQTEDQQELRIRPETSILPLLRANRVGEACVIAMRRLRASGFLPMPHARAGEASRDMEWLGSQFSGVEGRRLAAALLIPISSGSLKILSGMVLRQTEEEENQT